MFSSGDAGFLLAQIAWWINVFPVNKVMVDWTAESMPPNWIEFAAEWERTDAVRAILDIAGFAALVLSILGRSRPQKVVQFFRNYFGPMRVAFFQLNPQKQNEYAAELETLWRAQNQATGDRTSVHADSRSAGEASVISNCAMKA